MEAPDSQHHHSIRNNTGPGPRKGTDRMLTRLRRVARRDDGASAVEYGLLVAAIAAVIIVVVFAFGGIVRDVFQDTCDELVSTGNPGLGQETDACDGTPPAEAPE